MADHMGQRAVPIAALCWNRLLPEKLMQRDALAERGGSTVGRATSE